MVAVCVIPPTPSARCDAPQSRPLRIGSLLVVRDSSLQRLGDIAMPAVLTAVQALNSGLLKVDDPVAPV